MVYGPALDLPGKAWRYSIHVKHAKGRKTGNFKHERKRLNGNHKSVRAARTKHHDRFRQYENPGYRAKRESETPAWLYKFRRCCHASHHEGKQESSKKEIHESPRFRLLRPVLLI